MNGPKISFHPIPTEIKRGRIGPLLLQQMTAYDAGVADGMGV